MKRDVSVRILRVYAGEGAPRMIQGLQVVSGVVPTDGYVVSSDDCDGVHLFISDKDIEMAKQKIHILASSWSTKTEDYKVDNQELIIERRRQ